MRIHNFTSPQKVGFKSQNNEIQLTALSPHAEFACVSAISPDPLCRAFGKRILAGNYAQNLEQNLTNPKSQITVGQAIAANNLVKAYDASAAAEIAEITVPRIVANANNALRTSLSLMR